jgi:hypothetical protein
MVSSKPTRIRNAETDVRKRRRHKDGGVEDVPTALYGKYVNKQGHVVTVVLDYDPSRRNPDSDYGALKRTIRRRAGLVQYDRCPVIHGFAELFPGETPCTEFEAAQRKRGAEAEDYCCKHVEQLIKERRTEHEARAAEFAKQTAGIGEKLREEQKEFQAELINRISDAMRSRSKGA